MFLEMSARYYVVSHWGQLDWTEKRGFSPLSMYLMASLSPTSGCTSRARLFIRILQELLYRNMDYIENNRTVDGIFISSFGDEDDAQTGGD